MSFEYKRSSFYVPGLSQNAVIKLIIACGVAFVMLGVVQAIMLIIGFPRENYENYFVGNVALPALAQYKTKFWTPLLYYWFNRGFWNLVTDMVWLYFFGSLVQMLIGYKQVIPIFIYSGIFGGIVCLLSQFIPGVYMYGNYMGPVAGLTGLASASITLSPKYRVFFTDRFSVPLLVMAGIFAFLMLLHTGFQLPLVLLMAGGALGGFLYIRLLQKGYKPGEWPYTIFAKIEALVTPNESAIRQKKRGRVIKLSQRSPQKDKQSRVDEILDKINQKGYTSLTEQEKEILMRAGQDNDN
jgi:membrane associated rhomboid family serine protease